MVHRASQESGTGTGRTQESKLSLTVLSEQGEIKFIVTDDRVIHLLGSEDIQGQAPIQNYREGVDILLKYIGEKVKSSTKYYTASIKTTIQTPNPNP